MNKNIFYYNFYGYQGQTRSQAHETKKDALETARKVETEYGYFVYERGVKFIRANTIKKKRKK